MRPDILDIMFELKEKYPEMSWHLSPNGNLGFNVPISDTEAQFLMDAQKMFAM